MNYTRGGVGNFAEPLFGELPRDPQTHKINLSICLEHNFGTYYETFLVGNLFDCLYNATCNPFQDANGTGNASKIVMLQNEMKNYWAAVSAYFANNTYVLGYDILNEPIAGDVWEHPLTYVDTAKFEKQVLQPMYQTMM